MKIGFVGKGGSGKSALSWLSTRALADSGRRVFALDADQNADLAHNLGIADASSLPWISGAAGEVLALFGLPATATVAQVAAHAAPPRLTLEPIDPLIARYSSEVTTGIYLSATGHSRESSLWSGRCSHADVKPAKILLAHLDAPDPWDVVVDSPAGTDMAAYGLHLGLDALVCAVEPTGNSREVARQVAKVASALGVPCFSVWTKADRADEAPEVDGAPLIGAVPFDRGVARADWSAVSPEAKRATTDLLGELRRRVAPADGRARLRAWLERHAEHKAHAAP